MVSRQVVVKACKSGSCVCRCARFTQVKPGQVDSRHIVSVRQAQECDKLSILGQVPTKDQSLPCLLVSGGSRELWDVIVCGRKAT